MPASSPPHARILDTKFAKRLVILNAIIPAALLVYDASRDQLGVNDVNFAIRTTGLIGLILLVLSLVITPLRRLTGWNMLISIRRNLGVIGFLYIVVHFLIFFWFDREHDVADTIHEIIVRQYLWFGFGALVLMAPLAITSTDGMVSRLGAKWWKRVHRLTYVAISGGVIHYFLLVKSDLRPPLAFMGVVGALLVYRFVMHEYDLAHEVTAALGKVAAARSAGGKSKTKKFWSGELKIARIFDETPDVKTFRMVSPDGGPLPFAHIAGQYLNLALTIDDKRVNRSYTIASSPTRNAYVEISVKKAANGYGSKHLHESWHEGDLVKVSAPAGKFLFAGHESDRIVLIAGGIGITPMMSVARSLTDRGWSGQMYLLFSIRKREDIVFRDELTYLQARFPNLHVKITLTAEPADSDWTGTRGQISAAMLRDFIPDLQGGPIMMCGPDPMMIGVRKTLVGMGIADAEIHEEAFVSPPAVDDMANAAAGVDAAGEPAALDGVAQLEFKRAGQTVDLPPELSVLEAAEEAGVQIPFECRSGICGQCKTKLLSGKVRMDVQDALTAHDRKAGLILACQAHAASADVVVDV